MIEEGNYFQLEGIELDSYWLGKFDFTYAAGNYILRFSDTKHLEVKIYKGKIYIIEFIIDEHYIF